MYLRKGSKYFLRKLPNNSPEAKNKRRNYFPTRGLGVNLSVEFFFIFVSLPLYQVRVARGASPGAVAQGQWGGAQLQPTAWACCLLRQQLEDAIKV